MYLIFIRKCWSYYSSSYSYLYQLCMRIIKYIIFHISDWVLIIFFTKSLVGWIRFSTVWTRKFHRQKSMGKFWPWHYKKSGFMRRNYLRRYTCRLKKSLFVTAENAVSKKQSISNGIRSISDDILPSQKVNFFCSVS